MKTAIWGWNPPLYQKYESGKYMILYNPIQIEENKWQVWYEDMDLPQLTETLEREDVIETNRILMTEIIKLYDKSEAVNQFTINGMPMWLDKETRVGLKLRFEAELASGKTETTLWYDGLSFNLSLEQAVQMLYAIELYASACYDTTQQHLARIQDLDIELESYDYRIGYPEKLEL